VVRARASLLLVLKWFYITKRVEIRKERKVENEKREKN
jgi:hypothetical protein